MAGPVTFLSYLSSLYDLIETYLPDVGGFADDNQLYLAFQPTQQGESDVLEEMSSCIAAIRRWMLQHRLKINDGKTEVLLLGSKHQLNKVGLDTFTVGNTTVNVVDKVRNLGVIFDRELKMKEHISAVCSKGFHQLYRLRQIRRYVDNDTMCTLVHAFVTSHLDYGNVMFYNLPQSQICRLQRLQNAPARLILRKRKFDSARECLKELHWLPVHRRVEFKIALFVYKYKQGILPSYLGDLIKVKTNQRVLRSDGKDLLVMPRTNTESFGKRAFSYAAPNVWNSLPEDIKSAHSVESFKKKLKTHLFKCSFYN